MKKALLAIAIAALPSAMMIGCSSPDDYHPAAKDTQLAAAAASTQYPANLKAEDYPKLTATVNSQTGQLTIHNFDEQKSLDNFDLWVNQAYVLHVNHIEPNSSRTFNPGDLYNSAGNTLSDKPAGSIHQVQIATNDGRESKLYNVQGPMTVNP
jgi:hypothetical protein